MIINDDCLKVLPTLESGSIDCVICDLPYGITKAFWDSPIPLEPLWVEYKRIIKLNRSIVLFATQPFASALVMSNPKWYKYSWIWDKVIPIGFQRAKYRPMQQHEEILVFSKGKCRWFPQMEKRDKPRKIYGCYSRSDVCPLTGPDINSFHISESKYPKSILTHSNANRRNRYHPSQKPLPILEYLIKTYSLEGETILDNAMGGGNTLVAAKKLNRNFLGIDISADYCRIAQDRLQATI